MTNLVRLAKAFSQWVELNGNLKSELSEVKPKLIRHFKRLHLLLRSASRNLDSIFDGNCTTLHFGLLPSIYEQFPF